jgi:hypothetical protein
MKFTLGGGFRLARRRRRFVEAERARIAYYAYMPEAGMEPKRLLLFFPAYPQ